MNDYVVVRAAADLPVGFLPDRYEGLWLDRAEMTSSGVLGTAVAIPTGRFEMRDDGAVAEIFEMRP